MERLFEGLLYIGGLSTICSCSWLIIVLLESGDPLLSLKFSGIIWLFVFVLFTIYFLRVGKSIVGE